MTDEPEGIANGRRVVRWTKNEKTQVIRTTGRRWSQVAETAFLEELAATANVRAAAAAAGFSTTAIYRRRMKWPGFAAAWEACLAQGVARIETQLIELASDSLRQVAIAGDKATPAMSVDQAMNVVRLHRASVHGGKPQRYNHRERAPDIEAVRASILRKIAAVERAAAREDARAAGAGEQ